MASRKPGREPIPANELAKTREMMSKIMSEKMKELDTSSSSLENSYEDPTVLSTRERLRIAEAALARKEEEAATSTGTRERLRLVEEQLASATLTASATTTRTRELLALKEKELKRLEAATPATSTRTRDKLAEVEAALAAKMEERTSTRTRMEFRNRQKLLEGLMKENSHADLVFMMDCTGSMGPYIESCKNQITEIVNSCVEAFENQMRVGFVGYRDHCDGPDRITQFDLNEDYSEMIGFLRGVHANGGGDGCEDIFGGLESVISLGWKHPNRILIHVGDAPQHGSRFNGGYGDDYSSYNDADPRGLRIENLIGSLKQLKISYFFAKMNNSTDAMIREFKKVSGSDDFIQEIDLKSPGDILNVAVHSVAMTIDSRIAATVMASGKTLRFGKTEVKEFSIIEEIPDMEDCPTLEVQWLECLFPTYCDISEIKNGIDEIKHKWKKDIIKKAENPFAQGAQRLSYHGLRGEREEDIVIKEFKVSHGRDSRQDYIIIMETQAVAAFLAANFNMIAPPGAKKITFLEVSVVQATKNDGSPLYYNVEKRLPNYKDRFTKWCNNSGYVNHKQFAASLDAFCHWTYDVTKGYLMVVDIQGVAQDDAYALTDPCIHCKDDRFGTTNFGEMGMTSFFKTHTCNKICQDLRLKPNKHQRSKGFLSSLKSVVARVV